MFAELCCSACLTQFDEYIQNKGVVVLRCVPPSSPLGCFVSGSQLKARQAVVAVDWRPGGREWMCRAVPSLCSLETRGRCSGYRSSDRMSAREPAGEQVVSSLSRNDEGREGGR